eukprot:6185279-Pleurochrysis_carterae.AAC.4
MLWKRGLKSTCTTSATLSSAASSKPKLDAQRDALSDSSPSLSRTWSPAGGCERRRGMENWVGCVGVGMVIATQRRRREKSGAERRKTRVGIQTMQGRVKTRNIEQTKVIDEFLIEGACVGRLCAPSIVIVMSSQAIDTSGQVRLRCQLRASPSSVRWYMGE